MMQFEPRVRCSSPPPSSGGVDIGSNTIIIDTTDTLDSPALSIKGTCGLIHNRAYAYLFYQPWKN